MLVSALIFNIFCCVAHIAPAMRRALFPSRAESGGGAGIGRTVAGCRQQLPTACRLERRGARMRWNRAAAFAIA
jgi:hypothetical protein